METRLFALAALGIALTACTNDNEAMDKGSVPAEIKAEISAPADSHADDTQWRDADEIGVSESRFGFTNVPYVMTNGKFEPTRETIFFLDDEPTTFSAYYPYNAKGGTLTATTDNAAQQNQPDIDFLYATGATASTHNPEVNFTDDTDAGGQDCSFHHCMSQISLTFEAGSGVEFSTIQPESYTLSGLVLTGNFDTETGIAKADENAQEADLAMELDGALSSSVILFPQTKASIGVTVVFNGNKYNATLSIPEGTLKAGNNYTYTVTVRNMGLSIGSAVISDWNPVSGGEVNAEL